MEIQKNHTKDSKFYFENDKILLTKVGETYEMVRTHNVKNETVYICKESVVQINNRFTGR